MSYNGEDLHKIREAVDRVRDELVETNKALKHTVELLLDLRNKEYYHNKEYNKKGNILKDGKGGGTWNPTDGTYNK